ncbi:HNH endonuclease [Actinomyces bowdenii]|uniref:HNH endonuclease n=1 Tax=Actinomyces bowdenii TaxID=131109 RepID=UPI00214CBC82|nr:HNH endonuclease signature motif containing protein [Actinomyces bowdenii]MCR2051807.1 HNH endonuclease [Actinomyces bowdenii]
MSEVTRDSRAWRNLQRSTIAAAARRNQRCALCGLTINYNARNRNADDAPSVDHIKPWRDHPNLRVDPANLQIVHQACNRAKGTTNGPPSISNTSRPWGQPTTQ